MTPAWSSDWRDDQVRLHPLIREFAARQTPSRAGRGFSAANAWLGRRPGLEDFAIFEALEVRRGVDGLQEDLIAILDLCPPSASDLVCSAPSSAPTDPARSPQSPGARTRWSRPTLLAQQVRNRAFLLGISPLQSTAEQRLYCAGPAPLSAAMDGEPGIASPDPDARGP